MSWFLYTMRDGVRCAHQIFLVLFIEESIFFSYCVHGNFVKIQLTGMHGFISGISSLFHWSTCLLLTWCHAVLITTDLWFLKSVLAMPPALFFFLETALTLWGYLWFQMNLRVVTLFLWQLSLEFWKGTYCTCRLLWIVRAFRHYSFFHCMNPGYISVCFHFSHLFEWILKITHWFSVSLVKFIWVFR